jgi:hypothetical protein
MTGMFWQGPWGDAGASGASAPSAPQATPAWFPAPDSAASSLLSLVPQVLDATTDPYRQVELLRAELRNAKLRGKSSTKVAKIEAKLRAAEARLARFQQDRASTQEWSSLGKLAIVTGVGFGVSLILLSLAAALRQVRGTPRRRS